MTVRIVVGDAVERLREMPERSAQTCVTSPPYWSLRDYGVAGQLGLERTPDEYVERMLAVFREVRRVLRDDGTLWLNLGDSYANPPSGQAQRAFNGNGWTDERGGFASARRTEGKTRHGLPPGLKPKDLCGIPWRVAFALQADGWVLRSDVIWAKKNCMPESVTDRPTKSHEYLFMFAKATWAGPQSGMFADISDADARWLALFLDTEGNITVKRVERNGRKWYGAQIGFSGSHRPLLEAARDIVGRGTVLERDGTNAPMYYLQLSNRQAADLLRRVYPFLIVKRRQARIAIHLQTLLKHRGGRGADRYRTDAEVDVLESLWLRNKDCNRFGAPDLSDVPEPSFGRWSGCATYYYDADAIAEPSENAGRLIAYDGDQKNIDAAKDPKMRTRIASNRIVTATRNARTVWTVATQPFSEAHFATFPPKLIEPCILAGTSRQACERCGAPWRRVVERTTHGRRDHGSVDGFVDLNNGRAGSVETKTLGWASSCECEGASGTARCTVLDPFGGAGTTGLVADRLGRDAVLVELNPEYAAMARDRITRDAGLFADVTDGAA